MGLLLKTSVSASASVKQQNAFCLYQCSSGFLEKQSKVRAATKLLNRKERVEVKIHDFPNLIFGELLSVSSDLRIIDARRSCSFLSSNCCCIREEGWTGTSGNVFGASKITQDVKR